MMMDDDDDDDDDDDEEHRAFVFIEKEQVVYLDSY